MAKKRSKLTVPISPEMSEEEGERSQEKYTLTRFERIPFWIKAVFIKYWVCGVVYFFVDFGLGMQIFTTGTADLENVIVLILVDGLIYGVAAFFIGGFLLDLFETVEGEKDPYLLVRSHGFLAFLAYLLFGIAWSLGSHVICACLAGLIPSSSWAFGLFREPLSFAAIGLAVDMAVIGLKNLAVFGFKSLLHKEVI